MTEKRLVLKCHRPRLRGRCLIDLRPNGATGGVVPAPRSPPTRTPRGASFGYYVKMAKRKNVSPTRKKAGTANVDATGAIDNGHSGLGELVRAYRLRVPKYQRHYAWEEENVVDLLDDLAGAIERGDAGHFVGSIVLTRLSKEDLEIVDGQQRLATVFMILCAIRDFFDENGDDTRAAAVAAKYIHTSDLKTKSTVPRLILNATDNPFFQYHVVSRPMAKSGEIKASTNSHQRIAEAFKRVSDRVRKIAEVAGSAPDDALIKWVDFIDGGVSAIRVIVPDHATAFTIFETLNDRGIELAISDLVKNFLYAEADDRIDEAEVYWHKMSGVLEAMSEKDVYTNFLRHFWSSYHGLTREREIFKKAKAQVKNKDAALSLCDDLARNAAIYAALANPGHPYWRKSTPECKDHVHSLGVLRMTQVRPLLLAVCDTFKPMEVLKALRVLVAASVRILISQSRGGTIEKLYADLALNVRNKKIVNATALLGEIAKRVPGDKEFEEEFRNSRVSKEYLARFYLRQLERYTNDDLGGYVVSDSTADVTLEHVLPDEKGIGWPGFDEETHSSQVSRIGNLCLLAEGDNASLGNSSFGTKKTVLAKSKFSLTSDISRETSWTPNTIDARSSKLASLAVKTWPMSVDMVKPKKLKATVAAANGKK